jgi:hypothetical protein
MLTVLALIKYCFPNIQYGQLSQGCRDLTGRATDKRKLRVRATLQHPGWAGNHIGFQPFPTSFADEYEYIPQNRPRQPFQTAQGYLVKALRLTDLRARSDSPFRLFGAASVGSQSLTGIARLYKLRNDPRLTAASVVWPFETGWAMKANWLPKRALIVHAEIYPSVRDPKPDTIKDRGQVTQSELNRETAARPNPHECDQCHFAVQTPRHVGLR